MLKKYRLPPARRYSGTFIGCVAHPNSRSFPVRHGKGRNKVPRVPRDARLRIRSTVVAANGKVWPRTWYSLHVETTRPILILLNQGSTNCKPVATSHRPPSMFKPGTGSPGLVFVPSTTSSFVSSGTRQGFKTSRNSESSWF